MKAKWSVFLILSMLMVMLGTPSASAAPLLLGTPAIDGDGQMVVTPTIATYGTSTTFVFTFTANNGRDFISGSQVAIVIPTAWTAPTTAPGAGHVSYSPGTCTLSSSPLAFGDSSLYSPPTRPTILVDMTSCTAGNSFTISYSGMPTGPTSVTGSPFTFETWTDIGAGGAGLTAIAAGSPAVTVIALPITVTADAKTKVVGAPDPALTYTVNPALIPPDAFTPGLARDPGETPGLYAINQGTLTAGGNYTITYVGAFLLIGWALSGNTGVPGATLRYTDGSSKIAQADTAGNYSFVVSDTWSGTVRPSKTGCTFSPAITSYSPVTASLSNQNYTANCAVTYQSAAAYDGWVLESTETSGKGGSLNVLAGTFNLGDNAANKQYRDILSFNTGPSLPDTAHITKATLKLRKQGISGGGNPFSIFQGMYIDMRKGFFGSSAALQIGDFQAVAQKTGLGPFSPVPSGGVYTITLPSTAYPYINRLATNGGLTQLRLRFKLDDNNNAIANYINFYSGIATSPYRPMLVIQYHLP